MIELSSITDYSDYVKQCLVERGLSPDDVIALRKGLETVGEIYYILEDVIKPKGITKFRVVTNAFHMPRCLEIYYKILGDAFEIIPEKSFCKLDTVPHLQKRVALREHASLAVFQEQFADVLAGDLISFETVLYTQHKLYAPLPESQKVRYYSSEKYFEQNIYK